MELTQYVESLRRELTTAADVGGEDARALAARLLPPLDAAVRLTLLEALSAAAEEISAELAPGSVDVRLRGGSAGFVVTPPPAPAAPAAGDAVPGPADVRLPFAEGDDAAMVRINLRLPANLKALIEDAAASGGISVNAWIVRAAAAGLAGEGRLATRPAAARKPDRAVGDSFTGWVR
jgi:HicB-like protein involved in pilus formation